MVRSQNHSHDPGPAHYSALARQARLKVLEMIHKAQTSHIGSNFSCIDLLTVLYEKAYLKKENWDIRDRIILSKGWAAASLYFFLNRRGLVSDADLESYCQPGSKYIGLAEPVAPGIEFAGGSMGHGLPAGVGMALAANRSLADWRRPEGKYKVYVLMSDGEMDCGTTWESAMLAAHHNLNNLTVIIDYNKFQALGRTNEVLGVHPLDKKWEAFNWNVYEIKGHDFREIKMALDFESDKPKVIIAHTIKGKGVSFMEDKLEWHYRAIDDESYQLALKEFQ